MPLQKLPTTGLDDINHRRRARETLNNILDHTFDDSRARTAAEVAASVTPVNYAYAPGDVRRYGVDLTGATTAIPALDAAVAANPGGRIYLPKGIYRLESMWTIADSARVIIYGDGFETKLDKQFNGDAISLGARSQLHALYLEGNYATRTGRGVIITTGDLDNVSWRVIDNCYIQGTESYGVEFTAGKAGYSSVIHGGRIIPGNMSTPSGVAAVKFPSSGESNNGNRSMINVWCWGQPIADCAACDNATIVGCTGRYPILTADSKKVMISACRIVSHSASGTSWNVDGNQTVVTGCAIAVDTITFVSTCAKITWQANSVNSGTTIVDNASGTDGGNEIDLSQITYVPNWTAPTTNPSIGNGVLSGAYRRRGEYAHVNIRIEFGSTTTSGTGTWSLDLPYAAARRSVGVVYMQDASGIGLHVGIAIIEDGSATLQCIASTVQNSFVDDNTPFVWTTSDKLWVEIEYAIE